MIASIKGSLEAIGADWAVIDVNGVGFRIFVPTSTVSVLGKPGSRVRLYTHLYVREDNLALYGFSTAEELSLFQILTGVSGIGPKLALVMLSSMPPDQLMAIIAGGNIDLLTDIPGVGKKIAGRLVLELKDKIGAASTIKPLQVAEANADVLDVLISLGYTSAEANRAVSGLPDTDLSLEEKVRLALSYFARR